MELIYEFLFETFFFVGLVGLGLLGAAAMIYYSLEKEAKEGAMTTGTVVELSHEKIAPGNPGAYDPIITFTLSSGEAITFTSDVGKQPSNFKVGQKVTVRYDPDDPQKAKVVSGLSKMLVPVILAFIGVVVCCLSVFLFPLFLFSNASW